MSVVPKIKGLILCSILFFLTTATFSYAQELHSEYQATWRGEVLEVEGQEMRVIPGTGTEHLYQTLHIEIIDGPRKGEKLSIENDYLELKKGDKFYFNYLKYIGGEEIYSIINIDRRDSLIFFTLLFVVTVVAFGGWQGVRSLVALAGSFFAIFYILLPGLLQGWNPLLVSFAVASAILFGAIFLTHGFNRESSVAYAGTMLAVLFRSIVHCGRQHEQSIWIYQR
ncbi:YibE/F family protein [Candidatus Kaiserbacteria bacterium]|nr:YibE/F family protein [Candidatus Kaiserbacteria bacterium]USN92592.1 MAG: YibE/F family protein [Candidatus Nomurabacteria bacterium]